MTNQQRPEARKSFKLYVGGKFIESESRRRLIAHSAAGEAMEEYSHASSEDLRTAAEAARDALAGWKGATVFYRARVVQRVAELVTNSAERLAREVSRSHGVTMEQARKGVGTVAGRMMTYAGRAEALERELREAQPVGVVAVLAPDVPVMLPMVSLLLPVILGGNTAVVLPSERAPLPALTLAEILATSDLPHGVINILAGKRAELAPHIAEVESINAIVDGCGVAELSERLQAGAAANSKRHVRRALAEGDWFTATGEEPGWVADTLIAKGQ